MDHNDNLSIWIYLNFNCIFRLLAACNACQLDIYYYCTAAVASFCSEIDTSLLLKYGINQFSGLEFNILKHSSSFSTKCLHTSSLNVFVESNLQFPFWFFLTRLWYVLSGVILVGINVMSQTLLSALRPRFLGKCEEYNSLLLIEPQICAAYSIPELYKT